MNDELKSDKEERRILYSANDICAMCVRGNNRLVYRHFEGIRPLFLWEE